MGADVLGSQGDAYCRGDRDSANFLMKNRKMHETSTMPDASVKRGLPSTMRPRQFLCAFILCVVPATLLGQQIAAPVPRPGSIRGTVTDADDAAIPGAAITVDEPASSQHRTLVSDETGS